MSFEIELTGGPFIFERYKCTVEAVLPVPKEEWDSFSQNDGENEEWLPRILSGSLASMYIDPQQTHHCVMVVGEGQNDGILCYTEGDGYVGSGYVPNGRMVAIAERYPHLQDYCIRMAQLADQYVNAALTNQTDGAFSFSADQLRQDAKAPHFDEWMFYQMLMERPEIRSVATEGENYHLKIAPLFQKQDASRQLRELSSKELTIMCAKHILWRDDLGGERADFSNCRITDANLSRLDLSECRFDGAVLERVIMTGTDLRNSSFRGALLKDCEGQRMAANHADFTEARFLGGKYHEASMEYCRMVDTLFDGCDMSEADLFKSCIQDAVFRIPDPEYLDLDLTVTNLKQWQSDNEPTQNYEVEM